MKTLSFTHAVMLAVFAGFTFGLAANALAETLVNNSDRVNWSEFQYTLAKKGGSTVNNYDGMLLKDKDSDTAFRLFCSDLYTFTSKDYNDRSKGQVYETVALSGSELHTDIQKAQLQSLFDHVYTKAFNDDYSVNNELYASLFQHAVWEIMNDSSDYLSLREGEHQGDLYITKAVYHITDSNGNFAYRSEWDDLAQPKRGLAWDITDEWFQSIMGGTWDEEKWSNDHVNLTVYAAEGGRTVSQTFIGVAPPSSSPTPEPATLLVIGLGLTGVAAGVRHLRRKKITSVERTE